MPRGTWNAKAPAKGSCEILRDTKQLPISKLPGVQQKLKAPEHGWQVSCIPGGRFLGEVHSSQKHYAAFHLQLARINNDWPGLAITYLGREDALSLEFWETIDAPFEVH